MKILSKLFIASLLTSIILTSCDINDDGVFQTSEVSRILDASVPDTMITGETYSFDITYEKESNCHTFSRFQTVNQADSLYFVRAITTFTQASNCEQEPEGVSRTVDFINNSDSNFTFKFLNDIDSLGNFIYITQDVIVVEE